MPPPSLLFVPMKRLLPLLGLLALAQASPAATWCHRLMAKEGAPEPTQRFEFTFSPYTHHWSQNPEHKTVVLTSVDEQVPGQRLCGLSLFTNSFGQPSAYLYVGRHYPQFLGQEKLFAKVTAGVLYGYVGQYENKVPLNHNGFSPGIIPSIGYRLGQRDNVQMMVLGNAALMFAWGRQF